MAPRVNTRTNIASFLTKADQLSIELSKLAMDPSDFKDYLNQFGTIIIPSSEVIQKYAKMYHRSQGSFDIKMKVFGAQQASMFNEHSKSVPLDSPMKAISTTISPIDNVTQTADRIDIVACFTYGLLSHHNWMLQVRLIKQLDNPLEFATKLQTAKKAIMEESLDKMDASAYDFVETILVRIDKEYITHMQLLELIDSVSTNESSNKEYQSSIFDLAKDIYRDVTTISQFKNKSGFKRLCSNAVELNRPLYYKQVLPTIDSFYMTDKMDGMRAMLMIDEVYRRSGHKRHYLGTNVYFVSDDIYHINKFKKPSSTRTIETDHTVLDVEVMTDKKGNRTFHCFDVIALNSQRIAGLPFQKRFEKFDQVQKLMEKHDLGSTKEFVRLNKETYADQIRLFYNKKRDYHIDGIIFTPEGMFYKEASKLRKNKFERVFDTEYANTISFKWKPLEQLTIDFYLMKIKKDTYALCSGVDRNTFERLKLSFFDGYNAPDSPNAFKYFPIQFETYDGAFDYIWTPNTEDKELCANASDCECLDGMVGEFTFADSKGRLDKPKLIRLRTDRVQDIAKGEYYGNALRYSELIWHSIQYPLTIDTICDASDAGYFASNDESDWYKASRNFNSFVKTYLLETYLYPKTSGEARIMDIAAGKGQDLARAIDVGYDEIVALDKDTDALSELLDRKYNLRVKRRGASANIHVKRIDLEESSEDNIKSLRLSKESADSIMINFAIHYICHAATAGQLDPLTEFAKICEFYFKSGGRLMITAFNGEDVFDRLKSANQWNVKENDRLKYSIKKAFNSDILTNLDQGIDVLLPFSAGNYYSEFLVNYQHLQKVFEEHGFKTVKSDGFESLIRTYKKQNLRGYQLMSAGDKDYVSLYGYVIFEKK